MLVDVVIPALNEERSIGLVVRGLTDHRIRRIVVADNGSTDNTATVARAAGAHVVFEPALGYGTACLRAIRELSYDPPDAVLFADGDLADDPADAARLLDAIEKGADLVIGSRTAGSREPGALLPQAIFGNWLATSLIRVRWGVSFTDLGPFRAVRWSALERLQMQDRDFGWTVEMQVKAVQQGMQCTEVPVNYRRRVGTSKVSGTIRGSVLAGEKILRVIGMEACKRRQQ